MVEIFSKWPHGSNPAGSQLQGLDPHQDHRPRARLGLNGRQQSVEPQVLIIRPASLPLSIRKRHP